MPTVALPDGRTVEFPEGMEPSAMQTEIEKSFPEFAPAPADKTAPAVAATEPPVIPTTQGWGFAGIKPTEVGAYAPAFQPPEVVSRALDSLFPSFHPESPEISQLIQMAGLEPSRAAAEAISTKLKGAVGSVLSPGGAVLAVAAPAAPELVGGILATTATPGVVAGAREAAQGMKEVSPAKIAGGLTDAGLSVAVMLGGAIPGIKALPDALELARPKAIAPQSIAALESVTPDQRPLVEPPSTVPPEQAPEPGSVMAMLSEEPAAQAAPLGDVTPLVVNPTQRNWDIFYENLVGDLDSFSPARMSGKVDYELQDVAQRFVDYAKADTSGTPIDKLVGEFAKQDDATSSQIRKLKASVKNQVALESKPAPPVTEQSAQGSATEPDLPQLSTGTEVPSQVQTGKTETPAGKVEPAGTPEPELVPQTIGIANATVDAQRADRGLAPIMSEARRADTELWDSAMARVDADPTLPDRLIQELHDQPRPMTDEETLIATRQLADLTNQLDQARWEGIQSADRARTLADRLREPLTESERQSVQSEIANERSRAAEADARAGEVSSRLSFVEEAVGRGGAGTQMGRAFRARQLLLRQDFSLAGLERKFRAAKEFEPLTESELATVRATAQEYAAKNAELESRLKEAAQATTRLQAEKELAELKATQAQAQAAVSKRVKTVVEKVGSFLDSRADAARARLKGKLFTLSPDVLSDLAEIGAANLYHIGMDLARWSAKMIADLGEAVRPHLDELWQESQRRLDASIMNESGVRKVSPKPSPKAAQDADAVRNTIAKRLTKRIADYEERIKNGDFTTTKRPTPPTSPEITRLQFELDKVKKQFHEKLVEAKMSMRSRPQKIFGATLESVNAMRAVLTSTDLSAVRRQGGFIVLAHPLRSAKSIVPMLKAFASEKAAFAVEQDISSRENYPLYRSSKLYLAEHGSALSKMEEAYMSRLAGKIPGIGPIVKASERAYTTFLNKLRADSFDAMKATLGRGGEVSPEEARILSNFINVSTGRGTIGMADQAAVGLNTVFFAPRFVASRFQMLLGQPLYFGILSGKAPLKGTLRARALVASEYARILAGAAVVYGLGKAAGASIETDPRSSDFGKMRFGNTRVDPLSGLSQVTVFLSREISGQTKSLRTGKVTPLRGPKVPYGGQTTGDVAARFLRFKLAPAPGFIADLATQKDAVGNPITAQSELLKYTVPISMGDVYQSLQEQGVAAGTAFGVLSIFGEGIQNFDSNKKLGSAKLAWP